jgi:hypothetical protein
MTLHNWANEPRTVSREWLDERITNRSKRCAKRTPDFALLHLGALVLILISLRLTGILKQSIPNRATQKTKPRLALVYCHLPQHPIRRRLCFASGGQERAWIIAQRL